MSSNQRLMKRPADVVVQFESSGRWPDDLIAIQKTKIAFLLKFRDLFTTSNPDITARVGLENTSTEMLNQAHLDIIYASTGASFRLRIHHDREQTLIERVLKDKSTDPKTRESAAQGLAEYKRLFMKSPAHTQALQKLCTRYPALSPAIRLTKKWFAAHLLGNHFPDALIEMFVIRSFTSPWPWNTPSSAKTGFLRTLNFLSRWDWKTEPLLVDLGDLTPDAAAGIKTRFEAWRKLDPSLNRIVLFVTSSADAEGTTWTDGGPSKVVAGRMSALARAATDEVGSEGNIDVDAATLFASPLADYDFVLYLNPAFTGAAGKKPKRSSSQFKNLLVQDDGSADTESVGFEPVQLFLDELAQIYGQSVMLFHGGKEGGVIAGLWSPFTSRRPWKVNLSYSTRPISDQAGEVDAEFNREAVLGEIARLGGDLVEKIVVNR